MAASGRVLARLLALASLLLGGLLPLEAHAADYEVTACWGRGWSGNTRTTLYCDHTGGQAEGNRTPTIQKLYAEGWRLVDVAWIERANDRGPSDWVYFYLERRKN